MNLLLLLSALLSSLTGSAPATRVMEAPQAQHSQITVAEHAEKVVRTLRATSRLRLPVLLYREPGSARFDSAPARLALRECEKRLE